ncbi:MAG: class I SAM-dependent methyltransferase [Alphaproteobacteria bacterium]|nr:class I SAM-dependent methyltransferase [Alphaproteobacteria bacterium]
MLGHRWKSVPEMPIFLIIFSTGIVDCATLASSRIGKAETARNNKAWLADYSNFADITENRFDIVCLFHVLEHIINPKPFLKSCAQMLSPRGRLIIEVPSFDDPLLTLYDVPNYHNFFFQKQHPYYYSASSLNRLLTSHSLTVEKMIPHQRYGLENHLKWLRDGSPGGDDKLKEIFSGTEKSYQTSLERHGKCDAVIAVARNS